MISPPPEVRKGDRITAAWANQLREAVLARTPLSSSDIGIRDSSAGYRPWVKRWLGIGGGGVGEDEHPWKLTTTTSEDELELSVHPGTVSGILPSNIFSPLEVSVSGTFYIKLKCESDGKTVNAVAIISESSADSAADLVSKNAPPSEVYITIGIIVDGVVLQVEHDNIELNPVVAFIESRVPPSIGEEPFVRWWRWGRSK